MCVFYRDGRAEKCIIFPADDFDWKHRKQLTTAKMGNLSVQICVYINNFNNAPNCGNPLAIGMQLTQYQTILIKIIIAL